MINTICLDKNYSTARLVTKERHEIVNSPTDKFESFLFLPEGEGRKSEGGLRTQRYYKQSYESKPLISIVTVVFNGEEFLEETIQSVINQTYDNVEYIIIDGGSTDGTVDIIKKYEDRIDYWVSEHDNGIYDAMNKGISLCSGEWINFMNAGDSFYDNEVILTMFDEVNYDNLVIHGKVAVYYENYFISLYGDEKIFPHQASFFRATYMKELKFDLSLKIFADGELLLRLQGLERYKEKYVDKVVARFYLGGIGNHPRFFFKRLKEEYSIKNRRGINFSTRWLLVKFLDLFGYMVYKVFGEEVYYTKFQKKLLKYISKKADR